MNPVVHFEMPAEDKKRMADFYAKAFGWKTQQLGEDMGNYALAITTDSDEMFARLGIKADLGNYTQLDVLPCWSISVAARRPIRIGLLK